VTENQDGSDDGYAPTEAVCSEVLGSVKARLFTVTHTVTRNLIVDWVRKPHSRREAVGGTYNDPFSEADPIEAVHHAMVVKPRKLRAGFPTETAA
jgi:hypothetical protein